MRKLTIFVAVGWIVFGCSKETKLVDRIPGTYIREYSVKILHQESGAEVGVRVIRDTIFIKSIEDKFEVSNHKWAKNDYDNRGWWNMEHSDDRPMQRSIVRYSIGARALESVQDEAAMLFFDSLGTAISKSAALEFAYSRISRD